jgi:hypothetical protein
MGQIGGNINSDDYEKNNFGTFNVLMIPQGNLIWGINSLGSSKCEKIFEPKLPSSKAGEQGFTPYKK